MSPRTYRGFSWAIGMTPAKYSHGGVSPLSTQESVAILGEKGREIDNIPSECKHISFDLSSYLEWHRSCPNDDGTSPAWKPSRASDSRPSVNANKG